MRPSATAMPVVGPSTGHGRRDDAGHSAPVPGLLTGALESGTRSPLKLAPAVKE